MITKNYHDPIYGAKVIAMSCTQKEAEAWAVAQKIEFEDEDDGECVGYTFLTNKGENVIWLSPKAESSDLVHECIHLVVQIFEGCGVILDLKKGDEHFAYSTGYWYGRLHKFFRASSSGSV